MTIVHIERANRLPVGHNRMGCRVFLVQHAVEGYDRGYVGEKVEGPETRCGSDQMRRWIT
jgi:hypothetical protein